MIIDLTEEALEYGRQSSRAIEAAGGDQLVQTAEADPASREATVAPALAELGAWELEPRRSGDELEAAAALCRSAGYWAVAYPVAERLARPLDLDAVGCIVIDDVRPAGSVAGLGGRWATVDLDGRRRIGSPRSTALAARKSAFVADLDLGPDEGVVSSVDVALGLVLPCWTLLGMLDRAIELTRAYVTDRKQFGQSLASFQGVQFQLTDAEVERVGLDSLAKHALWSVQSEQADALDDALALRLAAIEAADTVFRVTHQLHGATGFCDETTLSWVSRYSQPLRRLPLGLAGTRVALTRRIGRRGLTGLFGPNGERG